MSAHTKSTLDGLFKEIYADKLDSLIPDFGILTKKIGFASAKKTGRYFIKPVKLTNEHGFTYGSGLATLQDIISSDVDDAKVQGASMTLRAGFSYDAAANMASSKGSFMSATKYKFKAMMESATHRLEAQLLYGGDGLGIADSSQDSVTAVVDTKNVVIPITVASWASGIWAGSEGAYVSLHTTAADVASAAEGGDSSNTVNKFEIASVSSADKTITVVTKDGTEAAALVVEIEAADYNIRWYGAISNEMVGLRSIISNTGTLFAVSGASYSLWQGNTYPVGAANLTLQKIYSGVNMAVGKGLMEEVVVLVSPATFATMAADEAALRRYNAESKKGKNGFEALEFHGPSGKIEVVVHPMVREQEAMAFPIKRAERIGATDLSFNTPGRSDEMFLQMASSTGYECRLYSEQALFLPCPAKCVLFTGISNA